MSDVPAAPAAPAGGDTAPAGAEVPAGGPREAADRLPPAPKPKPNGTPAPKAGTRGNDGRFLPKDGTVGVVQPEGDAPTEKPPAEEKPFRFKEKLKVFGKEEEVDLDADGIRRELQQGRALRKVVQDAKKAHSTAAELIRLAKENPGEFLRRAGGADPAEWAKNQVLEQVKLETMDPNERRAFEAEKRLKDLEAQLAERDNAAKQERELAQRQQLRQKNVAKFQAALKASGLEQTHENLFLMTETARIGLEDGIEYTDAELAQETRRRMDRFVENYFAQLDGPALAKKLGAKRVQAILEATIAEFQQSQPDFAPTPGAPAPAPKEPEERPYIDEYEVARRLRSS